MARASADRRQRGSEGGGGSWRELPQTDAPPTPLPPSPPFFPLMPCAGLRIDGRQGGAAYPGVEMHTKRGGERKGGRRGREGRNREGEEREREERNGWEREIEERERERGSVIDTGRDGWMVLERDEMR